ncbi:pyridoxamine 5'-phosphate oxidase family protein [Naasia sp. SYSU D00948]|uniref:pyridoxamine 5'-phosphate oxidase family protein n=1 Tax=Naasia sp. SYSU D00948 TaxID=2817379 RepID=UPI0027DBF9DF|nr:pyridoxamine 5'-phosphate oxidase family protein [Naasia sp. SYSU D00948]
MATGPPGGRSVPSSSSRLGGCGPSVATTASAVPRATTRGGLLATTATKEELEQIGKIIKDARIGLLTTVSEDGRLVSRPLATVEAEFDGDVWFFTYNDADKVHQIQSDNHVNVAYESGKGWLSISGRAELVQDRAKIDEYWTGGAQAWFENGKDDPRIALIKVHAETAEYWTMTDPKPVALIKGVKAALTGGTPDIGDNNRVAL